MPGVHSAARQLLTTLSRGSLIDLGAGQGALSLWAAQAGFQATAVDANRSNFVAEEVPFVAADLNRTLPFADDYADTTVALEVVEHLENAYSLLREMYRVTRPGGHAIVSTPNESNLHARLTYFWSGFFADAQYVMRVPEPGEHYYPHINCQPLPSLEYAWRRTGFELVDFRASRRRPLACLLAPLMVPLQWSLLAKRGQSSKHADRESTAQVRRLMCDPRVLTGRILVFLLRKPATAARRAA